MQRIIVMAVAAILLLIVTGFTVSSCSVTVESGEMGIKQTKFGPNPGIQLEELNPGWHWEGLGEKIRKYPTRQRTYSYTREANSDGRENEEIAFADQTGLPMTADVNLTFKVQERKAADLYATWRQPFEDLLNGQIRNDVRSFIAKETEQVPVSCNLNAPNPGSSGVPGQTTTVAGLPTPSAGASNCQGSLMGAGRQAVIQKAFAKLQAKWAPMGVSITQMEWVGTIRYPDSITAAIQARTQTEQRTLAAQQKAAEARAEAEATIEAARGVAESTRLRGEALRSNPELIAQIYAQRSRGFCPPGTTTCIIGGEAATLVSPN